MPYKKMKVPVGFIAVPNHSPIEDLTCRRFGKWEVLKYLGASTWRCRCECGREKPITGWRLNTTKSCGRCSNSLPGAEAAFRAVFETYRRNAQRGQRLFNLSEFEARTLFASPCHYCGRAPQAMRKVRYHASGFVYNGIDRVDNLQGYVEGNCVACCSICNRMKFQLSANDFVKHVCAIAAHCQHLKEAANASTNTR